MRTTSETKEPGPHTHADDNPARSVTGESRTQLRELRRVIGLAEPRIELAGHVALVEALEAGNRILSALVIGRHDEHPAAVRLVGDVLADGLVSAVVLHACAEEERRAKLIRDRRRSGKGI